MGVNWIITLAPSSEHRHEYESSYRGQTVIATDLPRDVVGEAFTDMTPRNMRALASNLEREIRTDESRYDETTNRIVMEAVEWLRYWAAEDYRIIAEW